MRPGQKNRMRGGRSSGNSNNNNSRRGPNPLTRSYESNGPDVKVRGTPQHIAEKYMQLARDAHSSGDTVMAEAYLQHAEHYYRIIAAAQNAQQVAYNQANGIANAADSEVIDDEDEFEVAGSDRFTFRTPQSFQAPNGQQQNFTEGGEQPTMSDGQPPVDGGQPTFQPQPPQPRQERNNHERNTYDRGGQDRGDRQFGNRRPYEDRGDRQPQERSQQERPQQDRPAGERPQQDRQDRNGRRFGRDRQFGERNFADRPGYVPRDNGPRDNGPRDNREDNRDGIAPSLNAVQEQPSIDPVSQAQPGLPSFITAPVRPVIAEMNTAPQSTDSSEQDVAPQRRRRRTRAEMDAAAAASED